MTSRTESPTLSSLLRHGAERLASAGVASPRHDAERLAALALDSTWGDLWARLSSPVDDDARAAFEASIARRSAGEPLALIEGAATFHGHRLSCRPGVFVLRPETEVVVDVALSTIRHTHAPTVVDVGTGTGAIAVAIAAARPDARVVATDVSPDAVELAATNAAALNVAVDVRHGRGLAPVGDLTADLIVSNPPYIAAGTALPADVTADPPQALFAGPRGDDVLMALIDDAGDHLASDGAIVLEIGTPDQADRVAARLARWRDVTVTHDLAGRPRVVSARR